MQEMRWAKKKAATTAIRGVDPKEIQCSRETFDWMFLRLEGYASVNIDEGSRRVLGAFRILGSATVLEKDMEYMKVEVLSHSGKAYHLDLTDGALHGGEYGDCPRKPCLVEKVMAS